MASRGIPAGSSARLELGVSEFLFSSTSPANATSIRVRITLGFLTRNNIYETKSINVTAGGPQIFNWSLEPPLVLSADSPAMRGLSLALGSRTNNTAPIHFAVINENDRELGSGAFNLSTLLHASREDPTKRIQIVDARNGSVGVLAAQVRARDAVQLALSSASGTPQRQASSGGNAPEDADVRRAFAAFDTNGDRRIDADELLGALRQLGIASDAKGAAEALRRYDADGNGTLDEQEFGRLVTDVRSHLAQVRASSASPPRSPRPSRGGARATPGDEIDAAFDEFDTNRDGGIDQRELVAALRALGLRSDGADAARVMRQYASASGDIDRAGFARLVHDIEAHQGAASPIRRTSLARGRIDPRVRAVFDEFDADHSGDIDADELVGALARLNMRCSRQQAAEVLRRYDVNNADGKLDVFEFDRLVRDLQRFQAGEGGGAGAAAGADGGGGDARAGGAVGVPARIERVFHRFDADRNGAIDAGELRAALDALGMMTSASQARSVLAKYDADRNRTLDLYEFGRLVQDLEDYQRGGTPSRGGGGGASARPVAPQVDKAFREFDLDNNGRIDANELREALRRLGMTTSGAQAREVLAKYDTQAADGGLDVHEFEVLVGDLARFMGVDPRTLGLGGGATDAALERKIRLAFERFDADRNGAIDAGELREALAHLGMRADGSQAVQVLRQYDADRSGGIELREFSQLVKDLIEYQGRSGGAAGGLGEPGHGVAHDVRQAFAYFDRDKNGSIDAEELKGALKHLGIDANSSQAAAILRQYDADRNRTLDLEEFGRLVRDIRLFTEGGSREQIAKQLGRPEVADLFQRHRAALDELFNAYALVDEDGGGLYPTGDAEDAEVRAAFASFDRDSSGGIDATELTGALAKLGLRASSQQTQRVLARYDSDASRTLELDEFRQLVYDLKAFQGGSGGDGGGGGGDAPASRTPRLLALEELLSMMHGFNLIPKHLAEEDVLSAMRDMQTTSSAAVALQPFRRQLFDECLLRLATFAGAKSGLGGASSSASLGRASAGGDAGVARRLEAFLRLLLVYDLTRMRVLVSEHRLREACTVGDVGTASALLRERVAIDARDHDGWTALQRACAYGREECAELLVASNASLEQRGPNGFTAMHWACEFGHLPLVTLLLRSRAMPADQSQEAGWTPLQRACIDGHVAVVSALLNHGKDKRTGETAYPIRLRDQFGDTALHDAARNGHLAVVKELVAARAQLDAGNNSNETPLDAASKAGRRDVADYLQNKQRSAAARQP